MTTFNGTLSGTILLDDTLRFCSASIVNNSPAYLSVCDLDDVSQSVYGPHASRLPVTMREQGRDGHLVTGFTDDYYNRIHVSPGSFDLGAVISLVSEQFIVWNAFFEAKTCTAIIEVNGQEWSLSGLSPAFNLNSLAVTTYTLEVPSAGSPTFEGSISFTFTAANSPVVLVSGTRLSLFPWRPQSPVREALGAFTNVLDGRDGSEQRISIRQVPRQSFSFPVKFESEKQQARLDAKLFTWQKRTFGLPVWPELVTHTATITAGDSVISVDTTNADFRDNSLAIIWQSEDVNEVLQVETVAAGSLTLSTPVQGAFTGRKFIMPVRQAQMDAPCKRKGYSTGLVIADFSFAVKDNILLTGFTPAVTYKGLPVITEATAIDPTGQKSSDGDTYIVDYDTGDFDICSDSDFNINLQSHLFYKDTKAACWEFRKFIHSLYGQQGVFYVSTHKRDMVLAAGFGASDTSFNIENIGLADNMGVNALRTDLAFIFPDGTQLYREITGITKSGSMEIITIDAGLGLAVEPDDCVISFLDKLRLAADEVEFIWENAHELTSEMQLQAVKE